MRRPKARLLMVHEGRNASTAAAQIDYEGATQSSREFKRSSGDGPAAGAAPWRRALMRFARGLAG